jgi:hypothetical protein
LKKEKEEEEEEVQNISCYKTWGFFRLQRISEAFQ